MRAKSICTIFKHTNNIGIQQKHKKETEIDELQIILTKSKAKVSKYLFHNDICTSYCKRCCTQFHEVEKECVENWKKKSLSELISNKH